MYAKITEGRTTLLVPSETPRAVSGGVFFNPAARVNRDVSVAVARAVGGETFCDSMAGVGSRGIRIANEVDAVKKAVLIDLNKEALRLAKRASSLNGVLDKCVFNCGDSDAILTSEYQGRNRQDFVDIDPFGTPIGHLQAGLGATGDGGVLSITATDTAVLCGVHRQVCRRRYGALPLNNSFHHETAVRILVNAVRRIASSLDLGIVPVVCHSTRHYIRVHVRVEVGPSKADAGLRNEGYVICCSMCENVSSSDEPDVVCQTCGGRNRIAGPLWVGSLAETKVLSKAARTAEREGMSQAAKLLSSMKLASSFPPWSYSIERTCSSLGVATVSETRVTENLSKKGFRTARQPFEQTGVKTDAPHAEFVQAVWSARAEP